MFGENTVMKKICFFGGTFNPVHNGHIELVKSLKDKLLCDEIVIMPNGNAPHKENETDKAHRYNMVKLAFSDISYVTVSDYEVNKETPSYTWETLSYFKRIYPDSKIYFVMGMDNLYAFKTWKKPDKICELATLVFLGRSGFESDEKEIAHLKEQYKADVITFPFDYKCSSTEVREKISKGEYIFNEISTFVFDYILKNGLYGTEDVSEYNDFEEEVKKLVDEKRFIHSIGVAQTAYLLAKKNGADPKKAYFAGLVHDIAKRLSYEEQLSYVKDIKLDKYEKQMKKMLHAPAGAGLLKKKYKIKDKEILSAVRLHTKGSPDMTLFEKIIFISDYIEPNRDYDVVNYLREKTFSDIDEGIFVSCDETIKLLIKREEKIAPCLIEMRNAFLDKKRKEEL